MRITKHHLITNTDLNPHGTLFGGQVASFSDWDGFICASLAYPDASFVTKLIKEINFLAPAYLGDIIQVDCEITQTGKTSVTISIQGSNAKTQENIFTTTIVYVNVKNGKKELISKPKQF